MKDVPENELVSAYLDGELTAEEHAQVERLLAASPAARQLVDEFRALSTSLQGLPSHQIGEDISGQVLRRAERQMLAEPAAALPSRQALAQPGGPRWWSIVRRVARPRTLAWSGVAVAVAVLLMLMDPAGLRQPPDRTVATSSPAHEERSEAAPSIQASRAAGEAMLADEDEYASAEPSEGERALDRSDVVFRKGGPPKRAAAPAPSAPAPATPPVEAMAESAVPTEPAKAGMGGMAGQSGFGYGGFGADGSREHAGKRGTVVAGEARSPASAAGADPSASPTADQPRSHAREPETSLVVLRYNVTADAVRQRVFHKLLESQQISEIARTADARGSRARRAVAAGNVRQPEYSFYSVAGKPSDVIHVDVEATRDQIAALLGELHGRPEQFSLISYVPARGAESAEHQRPQGPDGGAAQGRPGASTPGAVQSLPEADDAPQKQPGWTDFDELLFGGRHREAGRQAIRRAEIGQAGTAVERQPVGLSVQRHVAKEEKDKEQARHAQSLPRPSDPSLRPERAQSRRDLVEQSPEPQPASVEEAPEMEAAGAEESEAPGVRPERPLKEDDVERTLAKPKQAKQPGPPAQAEKLGRAVAKYRVRFVMQVVNADRPDVAASVAKDSVQAEAAMEAPADAAEPAEMPAAEVSEPAEPEP